MSDVLTAPDFWRIFVEATNKKNPTAKDVRIAYNRDPLFKQQAYQNFKYFSTNSGRHTDPIILQKKSNGYSIIDGNRRVTKLVLDNLKAGATTKAFVCEVIPVSEFDFVDYWVPSFILASQLEQLERVNFEHIRKGMVQELQEHVRESSPARFLLNGLLDIYFPNLNVSIK